MEIRTVETANSVWKFNLDERTYVRFPRVESPVFVAIPYSNEWEPFVSLNRTDGRMVVVRPVPWGSGQMRMTGDILESDFTDEDFEALNYPTNN